MSEGCVQEGGASQQRVHRAGLACAGGGGRMGTREDTLLPWRLKFTLSLAPLLEAEAEHRTLAAWK